MKKAKGNDCPDDPEAAWRLLGMAVRAGLAVSGAEAVDNALKKKQACLIIVAEDSTAGTRSRYIPPDRLPLVPVRVFGSKQDIGHWTGHDQRAVAAILDKGFAARMQQMIASAGHVPGPETMNGKSSDVEEKVR